MDTEYWKHIKRTGDAAKARKEAEDKYFNAFLDEYNKNMNNID